MLGIFKRKKKTELEVGIFGEPIVKPFKKDKSSFKSYVSGGFGSFKQKFGVGAPKRKIHVRYLLKAKRVFAGFSCLICMITFVSLLPDLVSLLFFGWSYLFLDYVWKTRVVKWVQDEE